MGEKSKSLDKKSLHFALEPVELVEVTDEFSKLLDKIEIYNINVDKEFIKKALRFAAIAHSGQRRKSGHPFIYHGIQTASILADLRLDSFMIACGILHDILEDTEVTYDEVKEEFGEEVADVVQGLTKIASLKLKSREEQQAENFRKMILHTSKDPRTIIVKFADRLHNMRTLEFLSPQKRKRIAHETIEVFAPLTHRFGIYAMKTELEDLSFRWLYPRQYSNLKGKIERTHKERENYLEHFISPIKERLTEEDIEFDVQWRFKHLYSIYKKMVANNKDINEIFDIFAVRIIVKTIAECYHTFGIIHSMYTPIITRIKDYIATPKFNMYQSLHTTVVGHDGKMIEVQIRTNEMHQTAETGIAAHWRYKEGKVKSDEIDSLVVWLRRVVDWQKGTPEANEFMHELKMDLFQDEIFVFTPKGDLKQLPQGSTPVDFAFALHSEIGFHCSGAKVNEKIVPLDIELKSGQLVNILTSKNKTPNPEWLKTVKTAKARSLIRRWFKKQHYDESQELGIGMISKIEKQIDRKIDKKDRDKLLKKYHQSNWEKFLASLGLGDISFHSVQNSLGVNPKQKREKQGIVAKQSIGVSIQGMENMLVRYADCCKPLPGDDIIGFISRGRGLIIHRTDCENVSNLIKDGKRLIHVNWEPDEKTFFVTSIRVEGVNRKGFLTDITGAFTKSGCNIRTAEINTMDEIATDDFDVDVKDLTSLQNLMKEIQKVKGVTKVTRLDMKTPENLKENE